MCVCVILSVCVSVRTIKSKRLKLQSPNFPNFSSWVLSNRLILGQKVKGQGYKSTECKNILKGIEWPAWVTHHIEWPASSSHSLTDSYNISSVFHRQKYKHLFNWCTHLCRIMDNMKLEHDNSWWVIVALGTATRGLGGLYQPTHHWPVYQSL